MFFRKDTNDYEKGKMKIVESFTRRNHNYLQQSPAFNKTANINIHYSPYKVLILPWSVFEKYIYQTKMLYEKPEPSMCFKSINSCCLSHTQSIFQTVGNNIQPTNSYRNSIVPSANEDIQLTTFIMEFNLANTAQHKSSMTILIPAPKHRKPWWGPKRALWPLGSTNGRAPLRRARSSLTSPQLARFHVNIWFGSIKPQL